MFIKIDRFGGIVPGLSSRLITEPFGQTARNIDFESGAFTPTETDLEVSGFTLQNSVRRSIFLYDDDHWLEWSQENVRAIDSPLANDATGRLYWTGQDYPRVGTDASMIAGTSGYPAASWRLGVPAPEAAPSVSASGTPDPEQVPNEVSYVYTLVTVLGEEGPPSDPSALLSVTDTETVAVGMPAIDVPSGNYNLGTGAYKRIYRSNTGSEFTEYQFVAEVPIATTSYNDVLASSFLGELLPSETWIGPPDDDTSLYPNGPLEWLTNVANGIFAGLAGGKTLCFSEPYLPHAWPIQYRYTLAERGIGIGTTPGGVVALTVGRPIFFTGSDPGSMTQIVVDFSQACVNPYSIVDMGTFLLYASPDGLCAIENAQGEIVTKGVISPAQWRTDFYHDTYRAFLHEGTYVALWTDGATHGGWVYDPRAQEGSISTLTASAETRGGWYNPATGVLYKIVANKLQAHRQNTTKQTAVWKSKRYVATSPVSMSWLHVVAREYPVTVRVYGDGVLLADYTLSLSGSQLQQTNNMGTPTTFNLAEPLMRMPPTPCTDWEIEVESAKIVDRVMLAQSIEEIRGV